MSAEKTFNNSRHAFKDNVQFDVEININCENLFILVRDTRMLKQGAFSESENVI